MPNLRATTALRNAQLNLLRDALASGSMKLYTGPQPATPETAISGQKRLATMTLSDPCAPNAYQGSLTFSTIFEDDSAAADGRATWARFESSSGAAVFDCDVGEAGATCIIKPAEIRVGGPVRCSSFVISLGD